MPIKAEPKKPSVAPVLTLIETAIERAIDPYIRAAIRGTLRGFAACPSTVDDIAQEAKIGVFRGMALPWLLGPTQGVFGWLLRVEGPSICRKTPQKRGSRPEKRGSAIRVFRVIRRGSQTPWEVGVTKYASGAGRNCAKKYLRDRRNCQPFSLLENDAVGTRSGVPMDEVVEVVNAVVTDPRGREMVIAYVETPSLTVAEQGRRIGIDSRATACRVWNTALEQLRAWFKRLENGSNDA